ncbi:hypothetical protein MAY45_20325, partial [Escherichia coli]
MGHYDETNWSLQDYRMRSVTPSIESAVSRLAPGFRA